MEKQVQPDACSLSSTVTVSAVKDYDRPAVYTCDTPPPAYKQPMSSAVKLARIVAVTVVLVTILLGFFILAAAWIEARASCVRIQVEKEPIADAVATVESIPTPAAQKEEDPLLAMESAPSANRVDDTEDDAEDVETTNLDEPPSIIKLPLNLVFDDLAGEMIEKNQKAKMNCVVEKRKAEEIVDHQPKHIALPFGLNLTSDPRYVHFTGEKMAISCESDHSHRDLPMNAPKPVPLHHSPSHHRDFQQHQHQPLAASRVIPFAQARSLNSLHSDPHSGTPNHPPVPHPRMLPPPPQPQPHPQAASASQPGPYHLPQVLHLHELPVRGVISSGPVAPHPTIIIRQGKSLEPHFVHPRSVEAPDENHVTLRRTKRYACTCASGNDEE